jgi:hypothetical protein
VVVEVLGASLADPALVAAQAHADPALVART